MFTQETRVYSREETFATRIRSTVKVRVAQRRKKECRILRDSGRVPSIVTVFANPLDLFFKLEIFFHLQVSLVAFLAVHSELFPLFHIQEEFYCNSFREPVRFIF